MEPAPLPATASVRGLAPSPEEVGLMREGRYFRVNHSEVRIPGSEGEAGKTGVPPKIPRGVRLQ